jgi:large subunit ribosomal protein L34
MYFCFIGNLYGLCKELKLTRFLNFLAFQAILSPMSFTYNPKKKKRARTHGFLSRMKTHGGRRTIAGRRRKGRAKLAV